ncbi:MAG: OprO/OprP family phosphate-selective porin [Muribaculaceae bacterium]|nr:OprO/OprP family phosphate-selective porin [Muribaculaceae bacterium]
MKRLYQILLICAVFSALAVPVSAKEDITEELREIIQENEVLLDINLPSSELEEQTKKASIAELPEDYNEDAKDNTELDFELFKIFDQDGKIDEDSLLGKIYHSKISRTDIPSFLYQNELSYNYEKGPLAKTHIYGAYRGSLSSLWKPDYSLGYDNQVTQIGIYGAMRNPNHKFKIALSPITQEGTNYVDKLVSDIYYVNTNIPNHQLVVGYSRVQTGVEGGTSTYVLPFVARSQIARNFGGARSLAAKVIGNYQYMDYNLSLGSSGRYITSGMPGTEFNGWVNFKPLGKKSKKYGKVTIGGGFNGGHNRIDYHVASVYAAYHHKKLWSNFEAGMADGYSGLNGISSNEAYGYAATVGWKLNPYLQILGRVDQFDPNKHAVNDKRREYTVGLNWFIKGQALKVMLNYVFCDNENRPDGHKIILATQILL